MPQCWQTEQRRRCRRRLQRDSRASSSSGMAERFAENRDQRTAPSLRLSRRGNAGERQRQRHRVHSGETYVPQNPLSLSLLAKSSSESSDVAQLPEPQERIVSAIRGISRDAIRDENAFLARLIITCPVIGVPEILTTLSLSLSLVKSC